MKISIAIASLIAVAVTTSASAGPLVGDKLGWGPRAGEDTSIFAMSGIDTSNAVILLKQTREDSEYYCEYYENDPGGKCIDRVLATKMTRNDAKEYCEKYLRNPTSDCIDTVIKKGEQYIDTLSADCVSGKFESFHGSRQFLGKKEEYKGAIELPRDVWDYIILKDNGEIEHGLPSGEYDVDLPVFIALCPSRVPELDKWGNKRDVQK